MKVEREEVQEFYHLRCDWCGEESNEFEDYDALPEGWIEHKVDFDVEAFFEEKPWMLNATGNFGGASFYHFDSKEHLKLWKQNPPTNQMVSFVVKDGPDET